MRRPVQGWQRLSGLSSSSTSSTSSRPFSSAPRPPPFHEKKKNIRVDKDVWPSVIQKIPMRDYFPEFQLSNLVLDLDAEGNKRVRTYDEELDGAAPTAWQIRKARFAPLKRRIAQFEQEYEVDDENFNVVSGRKFSPLRITGLDILREAMRGPSALRDSDSEPPGQPRQQTAASQVSEDDIRRDLMKRNGIPKRALQANAKLVSNLLARQRRDKRHTPPDPGDISQFHSALEGIESLADLRKLVAILMQSPGGRELVSEADEALGDKWLENIEALTPSELDEVLCQMNDVFLALKASDLPVAITFAHDAFVLAMALNEIPAARMYLGHARHPVPPAQNSYRPFDHILEQCLWSLLNSLGRTTGVGPDAADGTGSSSSLRIAAYGLLTGRDLMSMAPITSCIQPDLTSRTRLYKPYLLLLAELGAVRMLWHELHQSSLDQHVTAMKTGAGSTNERDGAGHEKLLAGEIEAATSLALEAVVRNVRSGRIQFSRTANIAVATGDYLDDCLLDLKSITLASYPPDEDATSMPLVVHDRHLIALLREGLSNANWQKPSQNELDVYARCAERGVRDSEDTALRDAVLEAFKMPDIKGSMRALQELF